MKSIRGDVMQYKYYLSYNILLEVFSICTVRDTRQYCTLVIKHSTVHAGTFPNISHYLMLTCVIRIYNNIVVPRETYLT